MIDLEMEDFSAHPSSKRSGKKVVDSVKVPENLPAKPITKR
jgi:hypothetical protein